MDLNMSAEESDDDEDDDDSDSDDPHSLRNLYEEYLQEHQFQSDLHQLEALEALERLRKDLARNPPETFLARVHHQQIQWQQRQQEQLAKKQKQSFRFFESWLSTSPASSSASNSNNNNNETNIDDVLPTTTLLPGVYLHGGVGCGKTFLMNLFFESITHHSQQQQQTKQQPQSTSTTTTSTKTTSNDHPWKHETQKIHFHKFMLRIHQEMHAARYGNGMMENKTTNLSLLQQQQQQQQQQHPADSILPAIIQSTLQHGRLLCLDEFQVTDVADALILQRLFTGLWQNGCIVVATSNRAPKDLYLNGLQRDRFVPFIHLLENHCQIVSMVDSETDYRLIQKQISGDCNDESGAGAGKVQYIGGKEARKEFGQMFYKLVGNAPVAPSHLRTQGRKVPIPQAALSKGIARFSFEDLCQHALGAADYLVIGQYFHTVFVEHIPPLTLNELNWVRRFITFVDAMYEAQVKLILHSKLPIQQMFQPGTESSHHDEVFAFDRTLSRLEEMSSRSYLQKPWIGHDRVTESKAALLSRQQVTVTVMPTLGNSLRDA